MTGRICVFGLGEAGSEIADGAVRLGFDVSGYDPADVVTPAGVSRHADPSTAVVGADAVFAITAASDAMTAATQAIDGIGPDALYADFSTATPAQKRAIADRVGGRPFAGVALMGVVPGNGVDTPMLVSGSGASRFTALLGLDTIRTIGPDPGTAAAHKLVRSVVTKGLAAAVIEALRAAEALGITEASWSDITRQIETADVGFVRRLVVGSETHAARRIEEMEASAAMLRELGVDPHVAEAAVAGLRSIGVRGMPGVPQA